jgi:oligopeptide transport system substrate-binding protein
LISFQESPIGEPTRQEQETIQRMVREGLSHVSAGIPLVTCLSPQDGVLEVHCIAESTSEALRRTPDLLSAHLPAELVLTSYSLSRYVLSIVPIPGRTFSYLHILATAPSSPKDLSELCALIRKQIILSLLVPTHYQHVVATQSAGLEMYPSTLRQELAKWLSRYTYVLALKNRHLYDHQTCSLSHYEDNFYVQRQTSIVTPSPTATHSEFQRLLLATDEEFKRIRTPQHLMKLVRSQLWLKQHHSPNRAFNGPKTRLFYRVFRSRLHFPFGVKDVISIAISLRSLSAYERFDHRHIALACKRSLPSLEVVPGSFFSYRYSEEPTVALYMEMEKQDGSSPTGADLKVLKKELERELNASIEPLTSRIDIPPNEEDLLRNFLLLSQQCKSAKDIPQVIIQFHGQGNTTLDFNATLVRIVKNGHEDPPPLPPDPVRSIRCLSTRTSTIDTVRGGQIKQGVMILVQCSKESYLRNDRSINFLQAREAVVHYLENAFGKLRDLNGGLIYQQHQLLKSVQTLLEEEERKELYLIEDLFHSVSPALMKNLLGPEHLVTVFRQLLTLRKGLKERAPNSILVEEYSKETFIGYVCQREVTREEILQGQLQFQLSEHELAICTASFEQIPLCFVICLTHDAAKRAAFTRWLREKLAEKRKAQNSKVLRISLPRPTLMLDPRIGTDRTSGTVIKILYEGLMRLDPSGNPTPATAEEVLISNDGKTYTFNLRPTYWTNGQPVTSQDFEYAWKKILEPSFHTVFDYLLHPIRNARLVKAGKLPSEALGIHAVSDRVLVVELEKPLPQFLELCCLWIYSPLCKDLDRTRPGWAYYGDHTYVCNGPFKLKKWSRSGDIQVVKNEKYWDKEHVQLEQVDISIIEDPNVALQLFDRGELDWVGEPLSETPLCLFKQSRPDLHTQTMSAVQWFSINVQHPPFGSAKVRRALSYAVDRSAIVREVLSGQERISHSILPTSLSLLDPEKPLEYDLEKARKLFEEGLEEQNLSVSSLKPIRIMVYDQDPHKSLARAVVRSWEKAFHITFILDIVKWHEFFDRLGGSSYDILANVWYSWFKDPMYTLGVMQTTTNTINASRWSNEKFTALLNQADAAQTTLERDSYLREAETLVMNEMPIIPIFDYTSRYLKNEALDDIYVSHLGNVDFRWTTVSQPRIEPSPKPSCLTDEVRLYIQSEPTSLDPRVGCDLRNQMIIRELFEGLMRIGKDGEVEPALAERVTTSSDGLVYTFHLRPSKWSNGTPVTAKDFSWTIKSRLSPTFSTAYRSAFFCIRNARKAFQGNCSLGDVGVRAIDVQTLEISLERPAPYFLQLITNPIFSPVCKAADESNPRWSSEAFPKYVSNGPFVLKERTPKRRIVLERNPYYWNCDSAKSDRLSFRVIKDPQTALDLFKSGELDWYGDPCGTMIPGSFFDLRHKSTLVTDIGGGTFWLECRVDAPHLRSSAIRRALAYAIDRKELCRVGSEEGEYPALTILSRSLSCLRTPALDDNRPDLARSLFEQGLEELKLTKESFPPIVITHWSEPKVKRIVKAIQKQIQTVLGIRVETSLLDWPTHLKRLSSGEFQLIIGRWFSWFADPIYTLQHVKHTGDGINALGFEHEEYINLLDRSDCVTDPIERQKYLRKAEELVMHEMPIIPLIYLAHNYAKQRDVIGEVPSPEGSMELKWLEKTGKK